MRVTHRFELACIFSTCLLVGIRLINNTKSNLFPKYQLTKVDRAENGTECKLKKLTTSKRLNRFKLLNRLEIRGFLNFRGSSLISLDEITLQSDFFTIGITFSRKLFG
jgi:hypothetical protein